MFWQMGFAQFREGVVEFGALGFCSIYRGEWSGVLELFF